MRAIRGTIRASASSMSIPSCSPTPPSAAGAAAQAAAAPSLADYVEQDGLDEPDLRPSFAPAIASRIYRNDAERRLLRLNLERARALPAGTGRYVDRQPARGAALHVRERPGGGLDAGRRRTAGPDRPDADDERLHPLRRAQPLLELAGGHHVASKLAPTILKEGRAYFKNRGYEVLSDWSDHAHVIDPMSVDWHAVAAGQKVRMRQKPGPANSMGKMKFMFPNAQGIWLHDTPEKEKIEEAARLQSNGCVRLEDAPRLRALAVQRAAAQDAGRKARAEGQSAGAGAALHHLSDGGAERHARSSISTISTARTGPRRGRSRAV